MRQQLAIAARLFFPAYGGAMVWVMAGCGWGVVIGSALEAVFGRGADGLIDAAGETSLEAVAGALAGMVGSTLIQTCLHLVTLVPLFALMERTAGRYPPGCRCRGIWYECSARSGALASVIGGVVFGIVCAPVCVAAVLLESIHGRPVPCTFIQWGTLGGLLAGGIVGLAAMGLAVHRGMPESWREELRRGLRPLPR